MTLGSLDRAILAASKEGFVLSDGQGRVLDFNRAALELLGISEKELKSKPSPAEEFAEQAPHISALSRRESLTNALIGVPRIEGKPAWLKVNACPLAHENEKYYLVTFADVSELVEKERRLRESESRQDEAQRVARIGSWSFDVQSGKITWSPIMFELFPEDIACGEPDYEKHFSTIHPEDQALWKQEVEACLDEGKEYCFKFRVKHPDRIIWIEARGRGIKSSEGHVLSLTGTCQDITARVEMEKKIEAERAIAAQASKMASLGLVSAGVAHEINNPLAVISSIASSISDLRLNPERFSKSVEKLSRAVDRISRIVKGLRKFSRSSEGSKKKPMSLASIVRETISLTEMKSARHQTKVEFNLKSDAEVVCDDIEMEQVLLNLITNAIDAVKGEPDKWVRLSLEERAGELLLWVEDSGPGILADVSHRLFDPFFTTKGVGEGTGLGLSISKGIIEDHCGTIALLKDRKHTTFEIRLPCFKKEKFGSAA